MGYNKETNEFYSTYSRYYGHFDYEYYGKNYGNGYGTGYVVEEIYGLKRVFKDVICEGSDTFYTGFKEYSFLNYEDYLAVLNVRKSDTSNSCYKCNFIFNNRIWLSS